MIVVGLFMLLRGRKFVYEALGTVLGLAACGCLFSIFAILLNGQEKWMLWASLVLCIAVGVWVGILAYKSLRNLVPMVLCGFAVMLGFSLLATLFKLDNKFAIAVDGFGAILGVYIGHRLKKSVNIICTSLIGAFMVTRGAGCYLPGYPTGLHPGMEINNNIIYYFSGFVVLFIIGTVLQFKFKRDDEDDDY